MNSDRTHQPDGMTGRSSILGGTSPVKNIVKSVAGTSSLSKSSRSQQVGLKLNEMERQLKGKLANNYVHVRNAFLDLDENQDGYVDAGDLAKVLVGIKGTSNNFDYSLVEILIKMNTK